ncbi:hypothetical protein HK102_013736 [Quaeritorhiza haematococci]|nr:hypothetical protein HK102_013736 [Quaeritorhiza haematococci]
MANPIILHDDTSARATAMKNPLYALSVGRGLQEVTRINSSTSTISTTATNSDDEGDAADDTSSVRAPTPVSPSISSYHDASTFDATPLSLDARRHSGSIEGTDEMSSEKQQEQERHGRSPVLIPTTQLTDDNAVAATTAGLEQIKVSSPSSTQDPPTFSSSKPSEHFQTIPTQSPPHILTPCASASTSPVESHQNLVTSTPRLTNSQQHDERARPPVTAGFGYNDEDAAQTLTDLLLRSTSESSS